jgi:hypothetical protein
MISIAKAACLIRPIRGDAVRRGSTGVRGLAHNRRRLLQDGMQTASHRAPDPRSKVPIRVESGHYINTIGVIAVARRGTGCTFPQTHRCSTRFESVKLGAPSI